MNASRLALRSALGRRLPVISGRLRVPGLKGALTIHRDRWGVPYIEAEHDEDAWFGLGFCHGQDRAFQLESLLRVMRGTLAEIVGPDALAVDRLARRIGFRREGERQLAVLAPDLQARLAAYAAGINAGMTRGLPRRPHEFVLLRIRPSTWTAGDVVGVSKLQGFLLAANWDLELARLRILQADGPAALTALDPAYPEWLPISAAPGAPAGLALDRLAEDLAAFHAVVGAGGGSNSWAVAGARTASGRPLLACDPHLAPTLPAHWYLAHLRTPHWAVAGATFVGGAAVLIGHNGFAAWGLTAGLADNTDLFLEEVGPDGRSVRQGDTFIPCAVHREVITVKGAPPAVEEVLVTPRGPLVGPALEGEPGAISLRGVWLDARPIEGLLRAHATRSFAQFRQSFAAWPVLSFNLVYADASGTIGWLLAGELPRRRKGWGTLPQAGWDPEAGWEDGLVPLADMPFVVDPPEGYVASANNQPARDGEGAFLGVDFIEGYRMARICEALAGRRDWDVASMMGLQLDTRSLPWRDLRAAVLAAPELDPAAARALALLREWDGRVSADSPAAAVFELFLAEMARRVAVARAPNSAVWALGAGFSPLTPSSLFYVRRTGHLVRLLRDQPAGWFERPWPAEIAAALAAAVRRLERDFGPGPAGWAWGRVRPLTLRHPIGRRRPLDRVFDLGPFPWGGDANTVSQASARPLDPTANPGVIAGVRMVADVGDWSASRFVLAGGQSGNPFSPHYADQLPLWRRGEGIPIAWTQEEVRQAARHTLTLVPAEDA